MGLMSALIGATLEAGGVIEGIVPKFMHLYGWTDQRLLKLTVVDTMQERKHLLMKNADAIVAFPGGPGTLEELSEAISLKRLGQYRNPIIIFNQDGYYDLLLRFFDNMANERMLNPDQRSAWRVVNRVEDILQAIDEEPDWVSELVHYHG